MSEHAEKDTTAVLLHERRVFSPDPTIRATALIKDWDAELRAGEDIETYWAEKARAFTWFTPWTAVLDESNAPFYRWFVGATTNLAYNAVDRHLATRSDRVALMYVNENGDKRAVHGEGRRWCLFQRVHSYFHSLPCFYALSTQYPTRAHAQRTKSISIFH